jgi:uncharacterized protein YndB with AHSA1/START domain
MKLDVASRIGAVTREVTGREHEGRPARIIIAARSYDAEMVDVWDALTNAQRIPRWFLPVSGDLRLGGRYQLEGNAGGTITRCEPPRVVAVTWEFGGNTSWVNVTLTENPGGGTYLELEHIAHVPEEFWDQFGPGAAGVGWDLAMMGLGQHLASGAPVDPQAAMAWTLSEEGKAFVGASSEDWCRASMAAGTPGVAAKAAAERTTAFYTGSAPAAG